MEWRICFNTGETELVNNLNDTQAKVYVLLKMILKNVLRPCKKEITSYVMKNIVLWQAESNPQNKFRERSLFHWLHDGLRELRTAILTQKLSYYMIPERNLMAATGLHDTQRNKWVADITDMMADGPRVILRLQKMRKAVIASPEPMLWFSKRRMELEILSMQFRLRDIICRNKNGVEESDTILSDINRRTWEIGMDGVLRAISEGDDVDNTIQ
ncbi:hypothetical protein DPMN_086027 [Dreissena polymorpha]|uniref:Mab-21-like HhH/H2TH-like domain-containing protein n=1 Tax=Dreissena polymorpha TaxID=45954 RepID=A0A9D3YH62_DREPO|nr:hypothetical protein DPMN_086027 [Dreissena polymorpha]